MEWLLHQDLSHIKEILDRDTGNPMTSPGPPSIQIKTNIFTLHLFIIQYIPGPR